MDQGEKLSRQLPIHCVIVFLMCLCAILFDMPLCKCVFGVPLCLSGVIEPLCLTVHGVPLCYTPAKKNGSCRFIGTKWKTTTQRILVCTAKLGTSMNIHFCPTFSLSFIVSKLCREFTFQDYNALCKTIHTHLENWSELTELKTHFARIEETFQCSKISILIFDLFKSSLHCLRLD